MKRVIDEFNKLKNDRERWVFVMNNQDKGIMVICDNDDTILTVQGEDEYGQFDDYVGWSEGIFSLFDAIGINAESC